MHKEIKSRCFKKLKIGCDICGKIISPTQKEKHYKSYHSGPESSQVECDQCGLRMQEKCLK